MKVMERDDDRGSVVDVPIDRGSVVDVPVDRGSVVDVGFDIPVDRGTTIDVGFDVPVDRGNAVDAGTDVPVDRGNTVDTGTDVPVDRGGTTDTGSSTAPKAESSKGGISVAAAIGHRIQRIILSYFRCGFSGPTDRCRCSCAGSVPSTAAARHRSPPTCR